MPKILSLLCIVFFIYTNSFSQNYNWITPNKTYLKMFIAEDGVYRINRTDFTNAGISTAGLDPRTVKVYNKGVQIPINFQGETDGTFDVNDYLDFYGMRNYGGPTKTYDEFNVLVYTTNEYYNLYSDTNSYWIDWGGAAGLRMQASAFTTTSPYNGAVKDIVHMEKDRIYWIGEVKDGGDFRNFTNERFRGETWYWNLLYTGQSLSDTFSLPLLNTASANATLRIYAYPQSMSTTVFNEDTLDIKINNTLIHTFVRNDFNKIDTSIAFLNSLLSSVSVNTVTASYRSRGSFSATMFIDLFEIKYDKVYKFRNNQAYIPLTGTDTTSKLFKLSGYVSGNPISIYDVTAGKMITGFTSNADTLKFTGRSNSTFEIINKNITKKPLRTIQRVVPNLASISNGADYLIIYNSIFQSQVLQLKNHRETYDDFRVKEAEIQDIYDIFNYGQDDPIAVRNFVRYVYNSWQKPQLKYICLFGRASLDPKKSSTSSVYYKNLVPTAGNPSSDNYFSNINTGGFAYYNQIAIGRLPAYTVAEAQNMIENIITYETQPPAEWMKSFTIIGNITNSSEHRLYSPICDTLISKFILPKPVSGNPVRIVRHDTLGGLTFNYPDSIKNQINRGTSTVNYVGHAGSQDWELGMSDPSILNNTNGKFPLIFSMTCYTGKNGEPTERGFGERFMNMNNKGAIGFIGTTGWAYNGAGSAFDTCMYRAFSKDTIRRLGDIFKAGTNGIKKDSSLLNFLHTINCFTLQGDPAVKLRLPIQPEFSISNADYKLSDENPVVNQPFKLTIYPKNYGLHADSCKLRIQIKSKNVKYYLKDTTIKNFRFSDTVDYTFKFDSAGTFDILVFLDNLNYNPYEFKSDNNLTIPITTKNISYIPLSPVNNSVIKTDSVELTGLNPFINRNGNSIKLIAELDTTQSFNSPLKKIFANSSITGVSTKFKSALPLLDTNVLYYWRTNAIVNGDSTGWSLKQIFRYNPVVTTDEKEDAIPQDSMAIIYQNKSRQYSELDYVNTNHSSTGISLNETTGTMSVRSLGSNGSEASYFSVLNNSIHLDGGLWANMGLCLLKVRKLDGSMVQLKVFKMTSPSSTDSVLSFLNTFDTTHFLMGLNTSYVNAQVFPLSAAALNKFHQFGSTKIDSVRKFGWFDTWSFIGYLNATPAQVSESVHRYITAWIESTSSLNKTFTSTSGSVSYLMGTSNKWKDFSWKNTIPSGSNIKFDVYGVDRSQNQTLLFTNLTTNNLVDLNSVNAYQYPKLNLNAKLTIDTVNGLQSPVLHSLKAHYTKPAEIVTDLSTAWQSDLASKAGNEFKIRFNYSNAGSVNVPGVIVNIYKGSVSQSNIIKSDTINTLLKKDSTLTYNNKFLIPHRITGNKMQFIAEVVPKTPMSESYTFNNYVNYGVAVNAVYDISKVELYSDGNIIQSGDFVRQNPELKISIKNIRENYNSQGDSAAVSLLLNNTLVPLVQNNSSDRFLKASKDKREKSVNIIQDQNEFYYYPTLTSGTNKVKIIYVTNSEETDTAEYDVVVSNELFVKDFYNYPNPMVNQTSFIFNLSGSETPSSCKIKIYTISGRLIKEINHSPVIGYNSIIWDGRDEDGDVIANGTYLYKFVAEDKSKNETAIQKLVVLK